MSVRRAAWRGRVAALAWAVAALGAGAWAWPAAAEEAAAPSPPAALRDLLDAIPYPDAATAAKRMEELVALGAKGVEALAALVAEPGKTDDSKARTALHGLAVYVARPGAEAARMTFCEALRTQLAGDRPDGVKAFFIQQLRLVACPAAVPALSQVLLKESLCEDACHVLLSIGGADAAAAMRGALPKAQGRCRLTLIQGLGLLRDAGAAEEFKKAATDADREVRLAALYALGNLGDVSATDLLLTASDAEAAYERAQATDAALLLAERLAQAGRTPEAERIYRAFWKSRAETGERHVRCAAIQGLAATLGPGAVGDLASAMRSTDVQVRGAAIAAAVAVPGEQVTRRWVALLGSEPADARPGILDVLARRGGGLALEAVLAAMRDADGAVRLAALEAAGMFKGARAAPALVAFLASQMGEERTAARKALERIPGDEADAAVASALPATAPRIRSTLLAILRSRGARDQADAVLVATRDEDVGVRRAALEALETLGAEPQVPGLMDFLLKTADGGERAAAEKALGAICSRGDKDRCVEQVLKGMEKAGPDARAALIRILAKAPTAKALGAVRAALDDKDAAIQDAGVRALADWPDPAVGPDLLRIAQGGASQTQQVLALRGYVRLANDLAPDRASERLAMYKGAMAVARRPDERRLVLAGLAQVRDAEALKMAAVALADEALKEEAAAAAVRIGRDLGDDVRKEEIRGAVTAVMKQVLEVSTNAGVRQDAERVLERAAKP